MGEAAPVSELAVASKFPILAHFCLELSLVFFDKLASFVRVDESLSLRADIYLTVSFREIYR